MFESIKVYKGEYLSYAELARNLVSYGYERARRISEQGDFSMRGDIIDIFPPSFEGPVRIALYGNMVESIKSFSIISNETLEEHAMVIILPKLGLYPKKKILKPAEAAERIPLASFIDLKLNDYVVHIDHGIGIFSGFEPMNFKGAPKDHIVIDYAEGGRLYVPIEEMHLIQKYLGFERRPPKLYRLGTKAWQKTKERIKKGIHSLAFELLELNAMRARLNGFAFSKDTEWQAEFEKKFPFEETDDQIRSWNEVKQNMESPKPMDRLLCGDVGYGKTEVAMRAAFKAVMDNKQVAYLVPTTILAGQHYQNFFTRFKDFALNLVLLCRFKTEGEQKTIVEDISKGRVDIVIGTHRL